jgi:hypothetical protein
VSCTSSDTSAAGWLPCQRLLPSTFPAPPTSGARESLLFTSVEELEAKVRAFIEYYNRTMAKPFRGTYTGKPLTA